MSESEVGEMEVDNKPQIDDIQLQEQSDPSPLPMHEGDTNAEDKMSDSSKQSEPSMSEENQALSDKVSDDNSDQINSKKSRELKSLLALSKEANLRTNISHKRKKDVKDSSRSNSFDSEARKPIKLALDNKPNIRFPVTAEAELEEENEAKVQTDVSKTIKKKRDSFSETRDGTLFEESIRKHKKGGEIKVFKPNKDAFCWRCHREGVNVVCETCPRAYHQKCLKQTIMDVNHWPCPECVAILKAESTHTRSPAMKGMTLEHLCSLLKFAVNRMIQCHGSEPFLHPVSDAEFPDYKKYIIQPMDLTMLEKNIKENLYGSTQAFEADAKWLLHNSIIYNSYQSKLTSVVKSMIKICKQEMMEIENCPSCYLKANVNKSTWFVEVCPEPHILVWAKLKGFPYWPAKAMSVSNTGMVDVRFFGAHDRAWVHWRECYLYSEKDPNTFKQKRFDIEKCVEELNIYIGNLKKMYGEFRYAPFRTPLDPDNLSKQLLIFLPKYKIVKARRKSIRDSFESKYDDSNDGKSENLAKEEPIDETEKSVSSKSNSNFNSPTPDNDSTMEGYGTDDDMQSELDLESRKTFADKQGAEGDVNEDDEDLDDTQVPSNVSADNSLPRGKVRTRGGFSNSSGKLKILPRLSSDTCHSSEELLTPKKMSRRNSDQSVKSDSSRVSNISDKINRVNISEHMEITLGNEDAGCISISENISPPNGENSRSESEYSVEIKKKPVQVDINNAEFSISPNKLKMSDQLIRRLNDVQKVEDVKKSLEGQTNAENENNCEPSTSTPKKQKLALNGDIDRIISDMDGDIVTKHQTKLFGITSSNKESEEQLKLKVVQPSIREFMTLKQKSEEHDVVKKSVCQSSVTKEISKNSVPGESEKMDVDSTEHVAEPPEISLKKMFSDNEDITTEEMDVGADDSSTESVPKGTMFESPKSSNTNKVSREDETITLNKVKETSPILEKRSEIKPNSLASVENLKENKSNEEVVHTENEKVSDDANVTKTSSTESINKQMEETTPSATHSPHKTNENSEKVTLTKKITSKSSNKESLNTTDDEENDESDADDILFDKNNIFNVIHSSLSIAKRLALDAEEIEKAEEDKDKNKVREVSKKRKMSSDDTSSPAKLVKIVSIESILNKKDKEDKTDNVEKEVDKTGNEKQSESNTPDIAPEDIKSEPESDDESMEDANILEEKRKYLSALNIHEKTAELEKKDRNEIRTRSKAEEKRERFKVVDNLTRIIDDVALNYSAKHEGERLPQRKPERRKSSNSFPAHEGEIFVKSFARLHNPPPSSKQRARKSFPMPVYLKATHKHPLLKKDVSLLRRENPQPQKSLTPTITVTNKNPLTSTTSEKPITSGANITVTTIARTSSMTFTSAGLTQPSISTPAMSLVPQTPMGIVAPTSVAMVTPSTSISLIQQAVDPSMAVPHQTMAMGHVILMPTSAVNYCTPVLNTVTHPTPALTPLSTQTQQNLKKAALAPNLKTSQNYIPHNDDENMESPSPPVSNSLINLSDFVNQQPSTPQTLHQRLPDASESSTPSTSADSAPVSSSANPTTSSTVPNDPHQEDEFALLNGLIPESVSRAVNELLLKPPPRLKPRPPGITSQVFEEGIPSTAGDVTARINSISHRMTDYFRGMLIETLEDLGKTTNPEAKIAGLQLELETLKHQHSVEMAEVRKNMCSILKDIQRSILEEREKIIDDTRATCEAETIRRVEQAKSKQWCANCPKEAQFYCCWNTSYCDYPCQQKHWPQHAGKCTQSIEKASGTTTLSPNNRPAGQPIVLRPAVPPKAGMGRIIAKPAKVYMNRAGAPQKTVKTVPNSGLALVETTPGNYELVGNGSIGLTGKIFTATTAISNAKFKATPSSTLGTSPRLSTVTSDTSRQTASSGNRPHI